MPSKSGTSRLITLQDRSHYCDRLMQRTKSNKHVVFWHRRGENFYEAHAMLLNACVAPLCMPALLHLCGALECRPCSRRAFSHLMIRANVRTAPRGLPNCEPNLGGADSTVLWCRAPTASRMNICPQAK